MNQALITRIKRIPNRYRTLHYLYCKTREFMQQDEVFGISPGITYFFIMGFIPFLIFVVNVVLFSTALEVDSVIRLAYAYLPPRMAVTLEEDIQRIVSQRSDLWLWISLFAAAYSFEKGLAILVRATDARAYKTNGASLMASREFLVHIKSVLFAIGLVMAITISLGLTVFGNLLLQWLNQNLALPPLLFDAWDSLHLLVYAIPFVALICYLTIFYLSAPRSYTPRLLHAFVTAFVVTVLWLVATTIYRWLLMMVPSIGASYGPLFGLFTMFGWFYYIVTIIISGLCFIKAWTRFQERLDGSRGMMDKHK